MAQAALDLGRREEAQEQLDVLAAHDFAALPRDGTRLAGLVVLAEVCAELGERRHAATLYELLRPFARHLAITSGAVACLGAAAYSLALLATTLERWQEAEEHFQAAEAMHARLEARAFEALTWFAHGCMLLAQGRHGGRELRIEAEALALDLLDQARTRAEELGMERLAAEVSSLSRATSPPVRARPRATVTPLFLPDGLTPREAEILARVAAGRTSRQIAAELILAVDTVRRHTTNIYTKIGAHGRAEATLYALRHGLILPQSESSPF